MIIHEKIPKRKKRKPNAKQRELSANWSHILEKYDVNPNVKKSKSNKSLNVNYSHRSSNRKINSISHGIGDCSPSGIMKDYHRLSDDDKQIVHDVGSRVAPAYNKGAIQYISPGIDPANLGKKI